MIVIREVEKNVKDKFSNETITCDFYSQNIVNLYICISYIFEKNCET